MVPRPLEALPDTIGHSIHGLGTLSPPPLSRIVTHSSVWFGHNLGTVGTQHTDLEHVPHNSLERRLVRCNRVGEVVRQRKSEAEIEIDTAAPDVPANGPAEGRANKPCPPAC